ncbi:MAG: hypothetical protein JWN86_574 [Planctomycetota bacterium]|nr:hypothetical protein [Planctomycetota bacterium]
MNSAEIIIQKFGGLTPLAKLIGKGPTTVQYWAKAGAIPAKWHNKLLGLAQANAIDLSPSDFLPAQEIVGSEIVPALPWAKWPGVLEIGDTEIQCFVLSDGRRVISRTAATLHLAGPQGGGQLEQYLRAAAISTYIPPDLPERMVEFTLSHIVNKSVKGLDAATFIDICRAYVRALAESALTTPNRLEMANKAGAFLAACAKVGLEALIDEATGYQYERASDALQFKLKLYLADEMRKWDRTFPEALWVEFARLTNWKGGIHSRPKYWGKLVMELIYGYLDRDVAEWLRKNAPKPQKGQNYHQWLNDQYGLRKLVEHIWMVVGMGSCCKSIRELQDRMAEKYGRLPIHFTVYLPQKQTGQRMLFDEDSDLEPEPTPPDSTQEST